MYPSKYGRTWMVVRIRNDCENVFALSEVRAIEIPYDTHYLLKPTLEYRQVCRMERT